MAAAHISFSVSTRHGQVLRRCLQELAEGHRELDELLLVMAQMIDGDGSSSTQFPVMTARFGFESDAQARAAWLELNSLASKFNTDNSVSSVKSALAQAFAKLG